MCYPMPTKNKSISKCKEKQIRICAENILSEKIRFGGLETNCKKPCEIQQYIEDWKNYLVGNGDSNKANHESKLWFWLWYQFEDDQDTIVYEEYLIYDTINMIGSLGGTLGIFIGFSFSNVLNVIISWIQSWFIAKS